MPRATLKDVAEKANVSRTTVSLILNGRPVRVSEETRQTVLRVAQELQYTPNALIRSLQTQSTSTIGIYIGAGDDFMNLYIGMLFNSIRAAAEKQGYDVLVYRTGDKEQPIEVSQFLDGRVDGVMYWGGMRSISYRDLARADLPVVVILDEPSEAILPSLTFDDEAGMDQVLRHLMDLGHRRIAYIPGRGVPHLNHRLKIFKSSVKRLGKRKLITEIWDQAALQSRPITERLFDDERPTAAICAYDTLANDCMKAATSADLTVPDQLSIVSWEDLLYSGPLSFTSVKHQVSRLGEEAVKYLMELIQAGIPLSAKRLLPVSFEVRGTTGKAPRK